MILNKKIFLCGALLIAGFYFSGCAKGRGNVGQVQSFTSGSVEPSWIRNGEPIEFEGEWWYPQDGIEGLMDSEVYLLGEYRQVQYFADKIDVRPYDRIYTKFGNNKFRYYSKRSK